MVIGANQVVAGYITPLGLDERSAIINKVRSYVTLGENWDGYGGLPPSGQTAENVIEFLMYLRDYILPRPGLSGDGEINLFWEMDGLYIDIGFTGDGTFSYYAKDSAAKEYFGDNLKIADGIPSEILNLINKK